MFTGIVEKKAKVTQTSRTADTLSAVISTGYQDLALGESIAVNGICLTVAEILPGPGVSNDARFFISLETLNRTTLGSLSQDMTVNLERALTAGTRLSGHLVQGHVDGVGKLVSVREIELNREVVFELPLSAAPYVVEKGSIALDGVSLTVNALKRTPAALQITVMLIPHTWAVTSFSAATPNAAVNYELDVLAKYAQAREQDAQATLETLPAEAPPPSFEQALDELRAGRMVILVDDEDRENEGDLVLPPSSSRPRPSTSWRPTRAG